MTISFYLFVYKADQYLFVEIRQQPYIYRRYVRHLETVVTTVRNQNEVWIFSNLSNVRNKTLCQYEFLYMYVCLYSKYYAIAYGQFLDPNLNMNNNRFHHKQ